MSHHNINEDRFMEEVNDDVVLHNYTPVEFDGQVNQSVDGPNEHEDAENW